MYTGCVRLIGGLAGRGLSFKGRSTFPRAPWQICVCIKWDTLWLFNIAMENGPNRNRWFSHLETSIYSGFFIAMSVITRWYTGTMVTSLTLWRGWPIMGIDKGKHAPPKNKLLRLVNYYYLSRYIYYVLELIIDYIHYIYYIYTYIEDTEKEMFSRARKKSRQVLLIWGMQDPWPARDVFGVFGRAIIESPLDLKSSASCAGHRPISPWKKDLPRWFYGCRALTLTAGFCWWRLASKEKLYDKPRDVWDTKFSDKQIFFFCLGENHFVYLPKECRFMNMGWTSTTASIDDDPHWHKF